MSTRLWCTAWGALLLCLLGAGRASARDGGAFLNVGIKIGYTIGPAGGFTMGVEASATWLTGEQGVIPGIVVGSYACKKRVVTHLGIQATHIRSLFGLGIGPAFVSEEEAPQLGMKLDAYWGLLAMPHYSHVFRAGKPGLDELGLYLKLPIPLRRDMFWQ